MDYATLEEDRDVSFSGNGAKDTDQEPDEIEEDLDEIHASVLKTCDDEPAVEVEETEVEQRGSSPAPEVEFEAVALNTLENVALVAATSETKVVERCLEDAYDRMAADMVQKHLHPSHTPEQSGDDHLQPSSNKFQDGYTFQFESEAGGKNVVGEFEPHSSTADRNFTSSSEKDNACTSDAPSGTGAMALLKSKKPRAKVQEKPLTPQGELEQERRAEVMGVRPVKPQASQDRVVRHSATKVGNPVGPEVPIGAPGSSVGPAVSAEHRQTKHNLSQGGGHPTRLRRIVKDSQQSDAEDKGDSGSALSAAEGGSPLLHPVGPKPSRSRSHYVKRRAQGQSATSGGDVDLSKAVLPPIAGLGHPRSSPQPTHSSQDDSSNRAERKVRKPLYQRMIERAQQQYQEEERQKHEAYVEKRKLKQRSNPTAEELRDHRRRHDELVAAKMEEHRRQLADAVAANARAVRRQQAVAAAVETALGEGGDRAALLVAGTSPMRKQLGRKKDGAPAQTAVEAAAGVGCGRESTGLSPTKELRSWPLVEDGSGVSVRLLLGDVDTAEALPVDMIEDGDCGDGDRDQPADSRRQDQQAPKHVQLQFDETAAAAAVKRVPALSPRAIPAYCAADWIDVLVTADYTSDPERRGAAALIGSGVAVNSSSAQILTVTLRPVPAHPEALRLLDMAQL